MVKLGRASEAALESAGAAAGAGGAATDALVAAYALAPAPATALRTPQLHDRVLAEAQNVMALTHVDTPLKGGLNTPLPHGPAGPFAPPAGAAATPNAVLATPFREPGGPRSQRSEASTPGFGTPGGLKVSANAIHEKFIKIQ